MKNLKLTVDYVGQPYVDDPIYANPKPISPLAQHLAFVFGRRLPQPVIVGYERTRYRWMKPGKDGKLVEMK